MRTIVLGDIHGCLDEFRELVQRLDVQSSDHVLLAGDLMDRGPDPVGCVQFARESRFLSVLGNHEERHLRWRRHNIHLGAERAGPSRTEATFHEHPHGVTSENMGHYSDGEWYPDPNPVYEVFLFHGTFDGEPRAEIQEIKTKRQVAAGSIEAMKVLIKFFNEEATCGYCHGVAGTFNPYECVDLCHDIAYGDLVCGSAVL